MSEKSVQETELVSFSERLANSTIFATLFREGMGLIEETAAYLDGQGREDAKSLDRGASIAYATESMRLTTRLMQLASWLLLHRAVKEGEMTLAQANREKTKVKLAPPQPGPSETLQLLPQHLQELISQSVELQLRVRRLDATIHAPPSTEAPSTSPVVTQMDLLKAAFGQSH